MDGDTAPLILESVGYDEAADLIAELDADLALRYDGGEAVIASAVRLDLVDL